MTRELGSQQLGGETGGTTVLEAIESRAIQPTLGKNGIKTAIDNFVKYRIAF
jgi:hypothetical protein